MRKVIALVAAAVFVLSLAGMASAAHQGKHNLETSGMFQTDFVFFDNENFTDEASQGDAEKDQFEAHQRLRQFFDYVASENLKATVGYEIDAVWGGPKADASADSGVARSSTHNDKDDFLELKRANMEFTIPDTETTVKSGIQWIELPSVALGSNPVIAGDMAGVTMSTPLSETMDLTFGWARPFDSVSTDNAAPGMDSFFAALPIGQDGFNVSPFGVYTIIGKDAWNGNYNSTGARQTVPYQDDASMYHLGATFQVDMFDPVGMEASFIYGAQDAENDANEASGYYSDFAINYKMDMMTPELFALYASGNDDDANTDGLGRMPNIYQDGLVSPYPSMIFGDASFLGIGGDGSAGVSLVTYEPTGLTGAGVSLKSIQLSESLSGTFTAGYYQGTNEDDTPAGGADAFTDEDSAYDITFAANYEIYEQLSAIMEAGYAKADYEDNIRGRGNNYKDEPATRVGLGLLYSF